MSELVRNKTQQNPTLLTTLSSRETCMAEQCARKSNAKSEHRSGPIGDDMEPIEAPREDVEM